MTLLEQILAQVPGNPLSGLRQADTLWKSLREGTLPVPDVVQASDELIEIDWDVVIAGGTLGILLAAALAQRGWRVAVLERGMLRGRDQEWNISRKELQVFVELGLLTEVELGQAIATQYNPARVSFLGGPEIWVTDVLNIGVDPVFLLETLKQKLLGWGGHLLEQMPFVGATVHPNGVTINPGQHELRSRLLLDAMGHFSPLVQQARQGKKPDAVCMVVGSCAAGFPKNDAGDLIVSFTPLQNQCQYFWEAFPARDGRTTYLFTYLDADPDRPTLEALFTDYLHLLPEYQNVSLDQLQFKRALFGFFPCYQQSPLQPQWNRILPVGDSSGSQSPLSFGGFGALIRHLKRLTEGIHEALQTDVLDRRALALLQPYQPNLAVTWLFQRAMSVGMDQNIAPNQINEVLSGVFEEMSWLGEPILKPFLQDVVQFPGLLQTMVRTSLFHPGLVLKVMPQVGLPTLLGWLGHYLNLAGYSALNPLGRSLERSLQPWIKKLSPVQQYYLHRWLEAWQYGAGGDYLE